MAVELDWFDKHGAEKSIAPVAFKYNMHLTTAKV
jgi:hypothetical protein